MRNYFMYDGIPSSDYGVYISGHDTFDSSVRSYNMISVPGKNGDDIGIERRFQNIQLVYDAFIYRDFDSNAEGLRNFLMSRFGYKRLADTYHPNEFRLAVCSTPLNFSTTPDNRSAKFQIVFNCKPQRFLLSGEQVVSLRISGSIENPTPYPAKPLLRAYGTGTLTIGNVSIQITSADEYTDIDCEIMEAFKDGVSCNGNVVINGRDFPALEPGTNNISLEGITQVDIVPRWWIL